MLTREEIIKLPLDDLRDRICKSYGVFMHQNVQARNHEDGTMYILDDVCPECRTITKKWDPTVFMEDAELLIKHEKNAYFCLVRTNSTHWSPAPWGPVHWECRFYAPEKGEMPGNTAQEAISRAWYFWNQTEESNRRGQS